MWEPGESLEQRKDRLWLTVKMLPLATALIYPRVARMEAHQCEAPVAWWLGEHGG